MHKNLKHYIREFVTINPHYLYIDEKKQKKFTQKKYN